MLAAFCHGGQEDIMRIDRVDIIRVLNPFKHPFEKYEAEVTSKRN